MAYANSRSVTVCPLNTSELEGARRWTAIQAYRVKGGIATAHLTMESESGPGYREWANRRSTPFVGNMQTLEEAHYYAKDMACTRDAVTGSRRASERVEQAYISDAQLHLQRADESDFFATVPSLAKPNAFYPQPEVTTFHALGNDLVDAAYAMAEGYGELTFDGEGAELIVAQALGASSLEHLGETWRWAVIQSTPLQAGRAMLRGLTAGPNVVV